MINFIVEMIGKLMLGFLKAMLFVMITSIMFPDASILNQQDSLLILGLGTILFFEVGLK